MKPEDKKPKFGLSINMEKIKGTLLNFVVPLVALAISLTLIFLVIVPSTKKLPQAKEELTKKLNLKQTLNTKLLNLNRLVDFKVVLDEDSGLVNQVLVSEAEVPRLLDQVNQIATNSGMVVTRLSYSYGSSGTSEKAEEKSFDTVTVSLGSDSNYYQLILFMQSIENVARYVSVPIFRYSMGISTSGETKLAASFSVDSPFLFVQSTAVTDEPINLDISSQSFIDFINMIKGLKYYEFLNPNIPVVKEEPKKEGTPAAQAGEIVTKVKESTPSGTQ